MLTQDQKSEIQINEFICYKGGKTIIDPIFLTAFAVYSKLQNCCIQNIIIFKIFCDSRSTTSWWAPTSGFATWRLAASSGSARKLYHRILRRSPSVGTYLLTIRLNLPLKRLKRDFSGLECSTLTSRTSLSERQFRFDFVDFLVSTK